MINICSGFNNAVWCQVKDVSGNTYVGGEFSTYRGVSSSGIVKINSSGAIDSTFNVGTGFANSAGIVRVWTMALDSSGKLYVGGLFNSYKGTAAHGIVKLSTNGNIDTSFSGHTLGFNDDGAQGIRKILIDGSGKLYVGGGFQTYKAVSARGIIKLNPSGSKDTSFDNSNAFNLQDSTHVLGSIHDMVLDGSGKLYCTGDFYQYKGVAAPRIIKLNTDGSKDTSFDNSIAVGGGGSAGEVIILDGSGKIFLGGNFTTYNNLSANYIVKLNIDGSIDNSFSYGVGFNSTVQAFAFDNNGKLIVGGYYTSYAGTAAYHIVKLNTDGSINSTANYGSGFNSTTQIHSIIVNTDNSTTVGGDFTTYKSVTNNRITQINASGNTLVSTLCSPTLSVSFNVCGNQLSWASVPTTTVYKVYRSTNGTTYTQVGASSGYTTTSYIDTTSIPNTTYYYKITNQDSIGVILTSNIVTGSVAYSAPAVSSVVGTECSGQNLVTWTSNSSCISGWKLFRSSNSGSTYSLIATLPSPTLTYSDLSLNVNQRYDYKVAALFSQYSLEYTGASANNTIIFSAPTGLVITKPNSYSLSISWTLHTSCETSISVERKTDNGSWLVIATIPAGSTSYIDYYVVDNHTYSYRVRVYKSSLNQYSLYSNESSFIYTNFYINNGANNAINTIDQNSSNNIVIGGSFTTYYDSTSANRIAGLKELGIFNTGFTYGTGFNNYIKDVVYEPSSGKWYVGGAFTTYKGVTQNRLIRLNADGSKDTSFNVGTGFNGVVNKIAIDNNGKIYVGGLFTTYNGSTKNRLVRLNTDGSVDTAFVVGDGFNVGNVGLSNFGVYDIAVDSGNNIYVGGDTLADWNDTSIGSCLTKLDQYGAIISGFNIGSGAGSGTGTRAIYSLALNTAQTKLYIGGTFQSWNGSAAKNIAAVNTSNGFFDTVFFNNAHTVFDQPVWAIKIDPVDGKLWVGGDFSFQYATTSAPRIMKMSAINGIPVGTGEFNPGTGFNNSVYDIKFDHNNNLYVVGVFTSYNGSLYNRIILLNRNGGSYTYNTVASNITSLTSLSGTSSNSILLTWQTIGIQPITGNEIYRRKMTGNTFTLMSTRPASATSYTITETISGDYEYKVYATRTLGGSESNTLILPYNGGTISVSRSAANQLDLSWNNTSSYATNVNIRRSTDSGSTYTMYASIPIASSYSDISQPEDKYYFYKYKYKNGSNVTTWFNANASSGLTYLNTPQIVSIVQPQNGVLQLDITWVDNSGKETGYEVYRRVKNVGSYVLVHTTAANVYTWSDTTIPAFDTYQYYVKAVKVV